MYKERDEWINQSLKTLFCLRILKTFAPATKTKENIIKSYLA